MQLSVLEALTLHPIGTVRSPHVDPDATPIQPRFAQGCPGTLELLPHLEDGLKDIEGFSHLILIYHLHRATEGALIVEPFMDPTPRGIFATRFPTRPNPIGLSVVRLAGRRGNLLDILDVDLLDGTPVLDIKPFYPRFDVPEGARGGWNDKVSEEDIHARGRVYDDPSKA
nr:tRNA (N6-threonylcarbamoyladenosine(37)-N6)-methyltransferase TrmO [uncultured Holophaga sp.]